MKADGVWSNYMPLSKHIPPAVSFSFLPKTIAGRHRLRCARSTERAGLIPIFDSRTNVRNFNCRLGYDHRLRFSPFRPRRGTAAS